MINNMNAFNRDYNKVSLKVKQCEFLQLMIK